MPTSSNNPEERIHNAVYQQIKEALQVEDYSKVLSLLHKLPSNYKDVSSIKLNARLGKVLSSINIFNSSRKQLGLSWTTFTAALVTVTAVAILLAIGAVTVILDDSGQVESITATTEPTQEPTQQPTEEPIQELPTSEPTNEPTQEPTQQPTEEPIQELPTSEPTNEPTQEPTQQPTEEPTQEPPIAPTNLQVSDATTNSLILNWVNPADDQTQIIVQQDGIPIAELPSDTQSYTVEGLICESSYSFTLLLINEAGQSKPVQVTAQTADCPSPLLQPPTAPTNVQVSNATETSLTFSWTNPTDNYAQIVLQQSETIIAELPPNTRSYTVNSLTCGESFNFMIKTVNDAGQSEPVEIIAQTASCSLPLSGKIAVPVFNNGMYDIYLASADNNWMPELLFDRASQPEFSEDGKGMVLRSWEHQNWGQQLIYLPNFRDITNFVLVTNFIEDAHPNLNNSKDIVFHSRQQNPKGEPIVIRIGTYAGAGQTKLGEGINPDWLGNRIIFYASFPAPAGIYVMDENGNNRKLILPTEGKVVPAAAPNGDRVAVSLNKDGRWQVFTVSVDDGAQSLTQLTSEAGAHNYLPTWSPNGNYIAYASNRDGSWAIWVMNADGSDQRKLFDLPGSIDGQISATNIGQGLSFGWGEEKLSWSP